MSLLRLLLVCSIAILSCCSPSKSSTASEAEVRTFLERYFSTWSAQDMTGYEGCFHPSARISFVEKSGNVEGLGLTDFIHSQKMAHQTSASPMKEVPVSMQIELHEPITQASVHWKLTKAGQDQTGIDFFTLVKTSAGWRIVSLAFYND